MNNKIKSRKPKLNQTSKIKSLVNDSVNDLVALQNLNKKVSNVISKNIWGNPDVRLT